MKAHRRALLLSAGGWIALTVSGDAQLQLKREPLPVPPPAPRVVEQGLIINGVFINNGVVIANRGNPFFGGSETGEPTLAKPDPTGPQVLDFSDGRRLHGTLAALDTSRERVLWERPDASAPLEIPLAQVSRWTVDHPPVAEPASTGSVATVKFSGSDWLVANVIGIQSDNVQLQLPAGPRFTSKRSHLEWIHFSKTGAAETYDGPTSLAGWTQQGGWSYRDGALYASSPSPITRTFKSLPDRVEYHFVVNQGDLPKAFTLSLHAGNQGQAPRGVVQFILRGSTLNLWASIDGNFKSTPADISDAAGSPSRAKDPMTLRIFEDVPKGRLLFYINGRKAGEWAIDKGKPGKNGGNFQFQPTVWSSEKDQTISLIRVRPWDGQEPGEDEERSRDSVALNNGEFKRGKLISWEGRTLKMSTEQGVVTIPASEIELLRFQRPANPPDDEAPVAHMRLAGRGEFDVVGLDWRDGKFRARTNFGGELTLPLGAIAELGFSRPPGKPSTGEDLLVFRNGDQLRGSLETAAEGGKLRWQPNPAGPVIEFVPTNIAGLQFARAASGAPQAPRPMVAHFRNGDWLAGALVTLDRQQLVVDTGDLGQVTSPRAGVKALYFSANGAPAVSDGTSDHEIWERGLDMNASTAALRKKLAEAGSPWSYFAGTYSRTRSGANDAAYSRAGGIQLGRTFETMPQRVEFSCTVSSDRMPVFFSMQIFTEPSNPGYMLHLSAGMLSIYDMNPRQRGQGMMQQQFPFGKDIDLTARERRLRILADRTSGRMTILVDGVVTAQVNPRASDGPRNLGRGIMISPQPSMALTVSNLWVGPWNGIVPGKKGAQPALETVALANGDEMQGTVEIATPSVMKVISDVGPLDLPVERLMMVDFGGQPIERLPATRLHLAGQGALTVTAWRIENGMLSCQSAVGGERQLPLKAIQEIVFAPPPTAKADE